VSRSDGFGREDGDSNGDGGSTRSDPIAVSKCEGGSLDGTAGVPHLTDNSAGESDTAYFATFASNFSRTFSIFGLAWKLQYASFGFFAK